MTRNPAIVACVLLVAAVLTPAATAQRAPSGWFTSWAQSQERLAVTPLRDQSIRMITRLSQGGSAVRIRLQNAFGTRPAIVDRVTAGISAGGAAVRTPVRLTFSAQRTAIIPAGGDLWSDPVQLVVRPGEDLAVSAYTGSMTPGQHNSAFRENYLTPPNSGDHTGDTTGAPYTQKVLSTLIVSAVDVFNPAVKGVVVPFGSSVVDGVGSTNCGPGCTELGTNKRWTDVLARRFVAEQTGFAVANAGISGTTSAVCPSTPTGYTGLDALARLQRDVLALHGVSAVIYYYGTNDLANGCTADQIITSYRAVFQRLRDAGIKVFVTPITPRPGYTDQNNRDRHTVAGFVKKGGDCSRTCTGLTDFDHVLADPVRPNSIHPPFDTGDGVHANIQGQQAIADFLDLRVFG